MNAEAIYKRDVDLVPHELAVLVWPDERLSMKCEDITAFDDDEDKFLEQMILDMTFTMLRLRSIGLAAPQVGITANLFVLLTQDYDEGHPRDQSPVIALINPEIVETSEDMFEWEEGCLSVPGYYEKRKRPNSVVVRFKTTRGEEKELEFRGLFAFTVQHEMDHLQGKCFVDNFSFFKKNRVKGKIKKLLKSVQKGS